MRASVWAWVDAKSCSIWTEGDCASSAVVGVAASRFGAGLGTGAGVDGGGREETAAAVDINGVAGVAGVVGAAGTVGVGVGVVVVVASPCCDVGGGGGGGGAGAVGAAVFSGATSGAC